MSAVSTSYSEIPRFRRCSLWKTAPIGVNRIHGRFPTTDRSVGRWIHRRRLGFHTAVGQPRSSSNHPIIPVVATVKSISGNVISVKFEPGSVANLSRQRPLRRNRNSRNEDSVRSEAAKAASRKENLTEEDWRKESNS